MKAIATLTLCLMASPVFAQLHTVAPAQTGAQREFAELLKGQRYDAALMSWSTAHGGTNFSNTDNGVALHALLMYKNGLPTMASQWVLKDTNPKKIDKSLKSEWIALLTTQSKNLDFDNSLWRKEISEFDVPDINSVKQIKKVQKQLSKTSKKDVPRLVALNWALATQAPAQNYLNVAEGAIRNIKGMNQTLISDDQIHLALARILYQKGQLNEAIVEYSQISKGSEHWLEALEERAWSHVRLNEYDKAMSDITTLLTPTFKDLVGPEVYFLANLTALKVCDYPRVLENGKKFKERNGDRIREIETLAERGNNSKINNILNKMDVNGVELNSVGPDIKSWPRLGLKSSSFVKPYTLRHRLLSEIAHANALKSKMSVVGENQSLNRLITWASSQTDKLKNEGLRALKTLARMEVKEYRNMINKLKLAEVEVIHHFNVDESLRGKRSEVSKMSHGSDVLVFPYDDEVWMDELDNYQARVKDCPTSKGASL